MRIPVFVADWPKAFNKFAKYLGRHWPLNQLRLAESREVTAFLFGYRSIHDLQRELIEQPDNEKTYELKTLVNSVLLRALNQLKVDPEALGSVLKKAPWREMAVWKMTRSYAFEQLAKERDRAGLKMPVMIMDELSQHYFAKSNQLFIEIYDSGVIPKYEYAVKDDLIYVASRLEGILDDLDLSLASLLEIDFSGSPLEFIKSNLQAMAWFPIKDYLQNTREFKGEYEWEKPYQWEAPYMHEVQKCKGGFRIIHLGVNGIYPGIYQYEELGSVLELIYKGKSVPETGNENNTFNVGGQSYSYSKPLKGYEDFLNNRTVKELGVADEIARVDIAIQRYPEGIDHALYEQHLRIRRWINKKIPISLNIKKISEPVSGEFLTRIFNGQRETVESLQQEGKLSVLDGEYDRIEIEQYQLSGVSVLQYFPELATHFDEIALGYMFNEYYGNRSIESCYERSVGFLIFVVVERLKTISGCRGDCPENFQTIVFCSLLDGKCSRGSAIEFIKQGIELKQQLDKQDWCITDLETYAEFCENTKHEPYLSVGAHYEVVRKSFGERMSELMLRGRGLNCKKFIETQEPK